MAHSHQHAHTPDPQTHAEQKARFIQALIEGTQAGQVIWTCEVGDDDEVIGHYDGAQLTLTRKISARNMRLYVKPYRAPAVKLLLGEANSGTLWRVVADQMMSGQALTNMAASIEYHVQQSKLARLAG